ncbi:patatin [Richelia sinica FACHB-800]|uniref:Patatin n=1 Tax=Richelia sinica FACHB-800 TaxID=1357546 RepID=A0A975T7A3_9NOST|nr:patatin-like phospholipase family protein [Richelia sinica]MBD2666175.1 patatin-like phospholipase family protein [Richelia sinica FACHB-800]QXE23508.1 patatin [Richelia sinica FACHB-800]
MSFRILSLDGGGIRGVISAQILKTVEQEIISQGKGKSLKDYFDLIAGTSTGSILTAGLALGKNSQQILDLYQKYGQSIFRQKTGWQKWSDQLISTITRGAASLFADAKYTHDGLIAALQSADGLGNTRIQELRKPPIILILAYDTLYRNTTFFTNCHPDIGDRWYDECHLWQICVASASAPTFFPPYKLEPMNKEKFGDWQFPHIDGGVSANNPSLAALSLALRLSSADIDPEIKKTYRLENLELENISILSVGTGQTNDPFEFAQIKNWKGKDWIGNLPGIFMDPTSEIGGTICRHIMGGHKSSRYLRLQFDLNECFKEKEKETYKDTRILLPPEERKNRFTGMKVSPKMDDASEESIQQLMDTADAYLDKGLKYYLRDDNSAPTVKQAIADFIRNN